MLVMSRTYRKNLSFGVCYGKNTDFYRRRKRYYKHLFRHNLNNLLKHYNVEDVNDLVLNPKYPKRDTWNEPTDGRYLVNLHNLKRYKRNQWGIYDYVVKKASRYLKPLVKKK